MIYGIRFVLKYLSGTDIADRNLAVYPDDIFVRIHAPGTPGLAFSLQTWFSPQKA